MPHWPRPRARAGPGWSAGPAAPNAAWGRFPITQLDARRLREGLAELERATAQRAARVRERARQAVAAAATDDDPCPALDPSTGTCDLYAARPITCRIFGPPVRYGSEAVGVCELCFQGASDEEIAACQVEIDPQGWNPNCRMNLRKAPACAARPRWLSRWSRPNEQAARAGDAGALGLRTAGVFQFLSGRPFARQCLGDSGGFPHTGRHI